MAILIAALAAMLLAGCGHNTVVYGDGIGFETTLNPETFTFGVNIRYGKILTAAVKEKAKVSYKGDMTNETAAAAGESKQGSSRVGTGAELTLETGDQITGYAVELEKVKRENPEAQNK